MAVDATQFFSKTIAILVLLCYLFLLIRASFGGFECSCTGEGALDALTAFLRADDADAGRHNFLSYLAEYTLFSNIFAYRMIT